MFAAICFVPLLILATFNFFYSLSNTESLLRRALEHESQDAAQQFKRLIEDRERELTSVSDTIARESLPTKSDSRLNMKAISNLPATYAAVAVFDADKKQILLGETNSGSWSIRERDFIPNGIVPDESVWTLSEKSRRCSLTFDARTGEVWRCSLPLYLTREQKQNSPDGALVADIRIDKIFSDIDRTAMPAESNQSNRFLIALDPEQRIVYHPTLRNQTVASALPRFVPVADSMKDPAGSGFGRFEDADGNSWLANYQPLGQGLSLAVARNLSLALRPARRAGWIGMGLAVVLGLLAGLIVTFLYQRKSQSLERVTASVAAIAGGKLDQELLLRSSDNMRGLADNVNLVTERLREQLARETESRQFDSFVKLSAMLAHDLKNAIEGLSLMVGNMERHFEDPRFRRETMNALAASVDKLKRLVARLSNPVNTLSGEYKFPRPTDLVPLLKRVIDQIAEPKHGLHEIEVNLPHSLFAIVDGERIEKVMENLVLNALEAMGDVRGKLSISAGLTEDSKAFFTVNDTGTGMTADFIRNKLFRPFSTTKSQGIGLGLYTCREVLRHNNGSITAESKPGAGTTFRVVLASAQHR